MQVAAAKGGDTSYSNIRRTQTHGSYHRWSGLQTALELALSFGDMCMYGLVTPNSDRTGYLPAKKPTQFMSNSWYVLKELGTRNDKSHEHQHLVGGRACKAAEYAFGLCDAICRGMARQKAYDRTGETCSGQMSGRQLQSVISSVRKWQEEEFGSKKPIETTSDQYGSCSGLARATDDASQAEELQD